MPYELTWFRRFQRFLALVLAVALLATAPAPVLAALRQLTQSERQQVEGAIRFLAAWAADDEWAVNVREWLDSGLIMADRELNAAGATDRAGRIGIRADLLAAPAEVPPLEVDPEGHAKTWLAGWNATALLANLLIHEMRHVHQAPLGAGFRSSVYQHTDWDDSVVAHGSCTGPDALEVEAYYIDLSYTLKWLKEVQETEWEFDPSDPLYALRTADWQRKKDGMIDFLRQMADSVTWVLGRENYEKADHLSVAFGGLTGTEHEQKLAKLDMLSSRIGALLEGGGPYERMRQAAQAAREVSSSETAVPDEATTLTLPGCNSVVVTISPGAMTAPAEVVLSTLRAYPPAPAGFSFVVPPGASSPVFRLDLEGEGPATALFHVTVDASGLSAAPGLWQAGSEKPARWERLPAVDLPGITVAAEVPGSGIFAVLAPEPSYTDIAPGHIYYRQVEWLRRQNVMRGMGGGIFGSGLPLQRAQFAAVLVRALDLPRVYSHGFADVAADKWYAQEGVVATVRAHDLLRGYSATMFGPEEPISREQVYTVLVRAVGLESRALDLTPAEITELLGIFLDAGDISPWARPCLAMAVKAGLWPGETAVTLGPAENMVRDEAADALHRLMARLGRRPV